MAAFMRSAKAARAVTSTLTRSVNATASITKASMATSFSRSFASTSARTVDSDPSVGPWAEPISQDKAMNHYVIIAEDDSDAGLSRRLSVRERHLHEALLGKVSGRIDLAGGLLSVDHKDLQSGQPIAQKLVGSCFVVVGESIEDVRQRFAQDQYSKAGVWDDSKIKIFPFLKASLAPSAATVVEAVAPSLGQLRQQEADKWKERAMQSLGWLREGGGRQTLA